MSAGVGTDYNNGLNTTMFTVIPGSAGGSYSVVNGVLIMSGPTTTGSAEVIQSIQKFGYNYTVVGRVYSDKWATASYSPGFGFNNGTVGKGAMFYGSYTVSSATNILSKETAWDGIAITTISAAYHELSVSRNVSILDYRVDGVNTLKTIQVPTSDLPTNIEIAGAADASISNDWIFVRKSLAIEPTTSLYSTTSGAVGEPIVAAFTASVNPSTVNTAVSFTDASTGTPTTWNWTIDGSITNTTQNAAYIFSTTGTHSVDLNVTNATGHFSNITHNQVVVSPSGFTQQDLWQTGHYTKTLKVTDSSSNAPIPVVVVTDDNGQSYTTTNGTAYFTEDAGAVVFYFAATGYVSKSMSYIIDGDSTDTVQMVASSGSPQQNTWYTPWQVRIRVVDFYGKPLPGTNVTASYIASTLPSTDTSWLVTAYGISSAVATDMVNSAKAMEGTTDDNGGLSFTMFKSLQYHLVIANVTAGVASTKNLYPSDQEYVIYVRTTGQGAANNTLAMRNGTLPWYSVNSTHINLNMTYVDTSLCTSQLIFRVWFRDNGTEVHNTTWSGFGASYVYDNHTVPKAPIGTEFLWGYNSTLIC